MHTAIAKSKHIELWNNLGARSNDPVYMPAPPGGLFPSPVLTVDRPFPSRLGAIIIIILLRVISVSNRSSLESINCSLKAAAWSVLSEEEEEADNACRVLLICSKLSAKLPI